MIIGPRIIIDKSFIQSLSGALVDELTLYFTPTSVPALISEIIADLRLPPRADGRIGEDIVKSLARKMASAHGVEPPSLRSLVVGNLHGAELPMHGYTLPVSGKTPGVVSSPDGKQLIVSQYPQQRMWERWAAGDFSADDEEAATAWRVGIDATDLAAERKLWLPAAEALGSPKSMREVAQAVDRQITDRNPKTQRHLIRTSMAIAGAETFEKSSAISVFVSLPNGTRVIDYAPYAASVARLYLCFAIGLALELISTRASNTIDLQYLFYAPFCRAFVSWDKLHRTLWAAGAVTSEGEFVWGDESVKTDLRVRSERRLAMTTDQWAAHRRIHGQWPEHVEESIITALWERHCPTWPRGVSESQNLGKHIDEIDDPNLRAIFDDFRKMQHDV